MAQAVRRRAALVDPRLAPHRDVLGRALNLEFAAAARWRPEVVVTGPDPDAYHRGRVKAQRAGAELVVIVDGPLSLEGAGLPASFWPVAVDRDRVSACGSPTQAAAEALTRLPQPAEQTEDLLSRWRAWTPDPAWWRPHVEKATTLSRDLFELLSGGAVEKLPEQAFWRSVFTRIGDASPPDELLSRVLASLIWLDPYDRQPVTMGGAMTILQLIEAHWRANQQPAHCFGAQYWNHPSINATFSGAGGPVTFHETAETAVMAADETGGTVLGWAGRTTPEIEAECEGRNVPLIRIEDGFLRSVGLGAGLARGAMLAVDDLGIYYDPSRPSRLERLLETYDLSASEEARGAALIDKIIAARVSKYNFGRDAALSFPEERQVLLVPGQVADDAAIRKSRSATIDCAATPNVNLDLLKLARERNPDAYIVYKPHPDVETGLRKGRIAKADALRLADDIAESANIIDVIDACDAVETFSSLSGFEALLRGKDVTVHGLPFYAGWGLSTDLTLCARRTRRRTLPELVYLSLVVYARTIDPVTLLPCSPEFLIDRLAAQRADRKHVLITTLKRQASWLGRKLGI